MPIPAVIAEPLRSLAVPIDSLNPDPSNARRHPEKNLEAIRSSLALFGQRKPIVVQREGMIVRAGNGTLAAAKALGWESIAAVILDDDNATALQFAIADNRTAELAEWDDETLASLINNLDAARQKDIGFDDGDISALLSRLESSIDDMDEEWEGMPSYEREDPCHRTVSVSFATADDVEEFARVINQSFGEKTKSIWYPAKEKEDRTNKVWVNDEP